MRLEEANAAGGIHGRKIRLVVEDHAYQVPKAIQAANKLVNSDEIFAMMMALGTPHNNAIFKLLEGKGVPNLFPFSAATSMTVPHHKLKFSHLGTNYDQVRAGLKYLVEKNGHKVVCVLYQNTDFGAEPLEAARDQAKAMGLKIGVEVPYAPTETDFTAAISQIKSSGCQVVAMGSIIKDTIISLATARKLGIVPGDGIDFVAAIPAASKIVAGAKGGVTEGLYVASTFEAVYEDQGSEANKDWAKRYKEYSGDDADTPAQAGYDAANLIVLAIEKAGPDLNRDSLIAAIEDVKDVPSVFGGVSYTFTKDEHRGTRNSVLMQVQSGVWVTIERGIGY